MKAVIDIPLWRLSLCYGLFFFVFVMAWWKKLDLSRDLFFSIGRMTIQLTLMGFILTEIFQIDSWWLITFIYLAMLFFAVQAIVKRSGISFPHIYRLLFISLLGGAGSVFVFFIFMIINNTPWYDPRYFIPLGGMILGNSMNGSALALERFFDDVHVRRLEIETMISFGATGREAAQSSFRKAFRSALLPMMMSMSGMGLVFLPGMMTGQILGGSSPLVAIKYQIAIMGAILGSLAVTVYMILSLEYHQFFDKYYLIREDIFKLENKQ
ncbi:iron export ABC transporter permease subunit FetB [bacterium]|nr:iron export ABC transporter permease subunit FetB [bacterium]